MKAAVAMPSKKLSSMTVVLANALIISDSIRGVEPFLTSGGLLFALGFNWMPLAEV